jgi:hypothetical protein
MKARATHTQTKDLQTESKEVLRILKFIASKGSISDLHKKKVENLLYTKREVQDLLGAGVKNIMRGNR